LSLPLFSYLNEREFAFNERQNTDRGSLVALSMLFDGRRLTYDEVTGRR